MKEKHYWYWINNIEGIGNTKIRRLLEFYGDAENIYKAIIKSIGFTDAFFTYFLILN